MGRTPWIFALALCVLPLEAAHAERIRLLERFPDPILSDTPECADPSPAEIEEAREKLQKWVDSNAPEAKTQSDVTAKILESFDKPANGQTDKQLNSSEVETLLEKADIGNILTRGCWASGIIDKFDTDGDKKLSTEEITGGLTEIGVVPPKAPPPTPTPS